MYHKLQATHKNFLQKVATSNYSKNAFKKIFNAWHKRTISNTGKRQHKKVANSYYKQTAGLKFLKYWQNFTNLSKQIRIKSLKIQEKHRLSILKLNFAKMRSRLERIQRYEVEKGTAFFKYSQKLMRDAFIALYKRNLNKKKMRNFIEKAQNMYKTRLLVLGISLFINNAIIQKKKADLYARVIFIKVMKKG